MNFDTKNNPKINNVLNRFIYLIKSKYKYSDGVSNFFQSLNREQKIRLIVDIYSSIDKDYEEIVHKKTTHVMSLTYMNYIKMPLQKLILESYDFDEILEPLFIYLLNVYFDAEDLDLYNNYGYYI